MEVVAAASAQRFAESLMPVIREIKSAGTLQLAQKQNERRILIAPGGKWAQVGTILNRMTGSL